MTKVARLIRSRDLTDAAEYAYAAVISADSQLVFCAGAWPLDSSGLTVGIGDVRLKPGKQCSTRVRALLMRTQR